MVEGKWDAVAPQLFTVDGTVNGLITVADTAGFRVKQSAFLRNNTFAATQAVPVQVKRVLSPTQLIVGFIDNRLNGWNLLDISGFTVASGAYIGAEQQDNNNIPGDDHYRAVYESDPVIADRVILVDQYGQRYSNENPLPAAFDGTISIGDVSIVDSTTKTPVKVNNDGSINVIVESVPSTNSVVVSKYNEILSIPSGATTQLISYTVPMAKQSVLQRCPISGENIGRYDLLINGVIQDTIRTMFGGDLSQAFDFSSGNDSGLVLNAGDVVIIQVLHSRPYSGDFEARIQVLEIAL